MESEVTYISDDIVFQSIAINVHYLALCVFFVAHSLRVCFLNMKILDQYGIERKIKSERKIKRAGMKLSYSY